ncbi:MAG: hypothetical protein ACPHL6_00670 [Rubripirellula sp.]
MRFGKLFLAVLLLLCIGCERLSTEYGESKGTAGRTSLNGFGAYRAAYENAGYQTRDISRLSRRLRAIDTIVWIPKVPHANSESVVEWMESWLAQGGRNLVYLLPDSGSEVAYWSDAGMLAPIEQQSEYRRREVRGINQQSKWRLNRERWNVNGWFEVQPLRYRMEVGQVSGPWAKEINAASQSDHHMGVIEENSKERSQFDSASQQHPCWVEFRVETLGSVRGGRANGAAGNPPWNFDNEETGPGWLTAEGIPSSAPEDSQINPRNVSIEPMVRLNDGLPIVASLRSDRWKDSRVLVVAGGSLLTNYALSKDWNCRLADQMILTSNRNLSVKPTVGFLATGWNPVPISDSRPNRPLRTGMEMLTEWPLSLITFHGIFLGGIVCLIMLPILGRPKRVSRESLTDFTHHLDAVGALLKRVKGYDFAKQRVDEYFQVVNQDSQPSRALTQSNSGSEQRAESSEVANGESIESDSVTLSPGESLPTQITEPIEEQQAFSTKDEIDKKLVDDKPDSN